MKWRLRTHEASVRFPFSNLVQFKVRPALIVSNDEFNKNSDVWACAVTSKNKGHCVSLKGSFDEGKLEKESFAKTNAITTMEKDLVLKIGKIGKEKTKEIIEKIIENIEAKKNELIKIK